MSLQRSFATFIILCSIPLAVHAQTFTILPSTALEGADCAKILDQYEVDGKIPNLDAIKSNQAADQAQKDAEAAVNDYTNYANSLDLATLGDCATTKEGEQAVDQKSCDEMNKKAEEAKQKQADAAAAKQAAEVDMSIKGNSQGADRDNLLGCAIKTGQVSLQLMPYFITYIANFLLAMIGIVCILFIVIGGYQYIYGGLIDQKDKGKKTIEHALMGMGVALLAWVIVGIIIGAVTS